LLTKGYSSIASLCAALQRGKLGFPFIYKIPSATVEPSMKAFHWVDQLMLAAAPAPAAALS
jgi:hypothetical protein